MFINRAKIIYNYCTVVMGYIMHVIFYCYGRYCKSNMIFKYSLDIWNSKRMLQSAYAPFKVIVNCAYMYMYFLFTLN